MTKRGPLARFVDSHEPLYIKPLPDCFDGVFFAVGYYIPAPVEPAFIRVQNYSRQRDARRALRAIGYKQEGIRWVSDAYTKQREQEPA